MSGNYIPEDKKKLAIFLIVVNHGIFFSSMFITVMLPNFIK